MIRPRKEIIMENSGIEPETSCILSTRSTNWANPPNDTKSYVHHYADFDITLQTKSEAAQNLFQGCPFQTAKHVNQYLRY